MSSSDSVSVFAEGTFQEQLQELIEYTTRGSADEERAVLLQSFKDLVKIDQVDEDTRRTAFELVLKNIKGLGQGTGQEIEGFFNLIFSHLFTLWQVDSPETRQHVLYLLNVVSSSPNTTSIKYRVLSNLFNAAPRTSALRLPIYSTLFQIVATSGELEVLALTKSDVRRWLEDWPISNQEKGEFLNTIIDTLTKAGKQESAYEYRLLLVHTLPPSSPEARSAVIDALAAALRIPTILDFDELYNLDPIITARDHELFALIQIYLKGGLAEFNTWVDAHAPLLEAYQLERSQLECKARLLVFASLAFDYIGRDLPYAAIASALQIETSQVDKWTIDVIRAGLVSGKLSQTTRNLRVYKSSARKFELAQWEALEKRLLAWKAGLASVIEVVAQARQKGDGVAEVVQATQNEQGIQVESTA